jgi:hypothetical protein
MRIGLVCFTSLLAAAACGSGDRNRPLSRLQAAGDACPGGGISVAAGNDDDGDGSLDDAEIDTVDLLCSNDTLTRIDDIPPGDVCPNGGTSIKAGVDDDDNGELGDPEVDTTQNVCKGTLVRSTTLAPEEAACFGRGGVRIELGVDDDGDDVLDVGEVDVTNITCNTSGTIDPPAGPAGASRILLSGGDSIGASGAGGHGGYMDALLGTSGGGSIGAFRTGSVDASFTVPAPTLTPGANPFTLPASANIVDGVEAPVGELYTASGFLYVSDGNAAVANEPPVTSLTIPAGVVATFNTPSIALAGDLHNNGTIKRTGADRQLNVNVQAWVGGPGSLVDLQGDAAPTGTGGAGGGFALSAQRGFFNEGGIVTRGGSGLAAGASGGITINTSGGFFNRGDLDTSGASATGAGTVGADGGIIILQSSSVRFGNSGNFFSFGGVGTVGGGDGGAIVLNVFSADVRNSGTFDSHGGGVAPTCTTGCTGGSGGFTQLFAFGGGIFSSGQVIARGGNGAGTGCSGDANTIHFAATWDGSSPATFNQGNVRLSGTVDATGGTGGTGIACEGQGGGDGGFFRITANPRFPYGQEVLLLGYTDIDTTGGAGAGTGNGGTAGNVVFYREDGFGLNTAIGPIVNYVDIDTSGGESTTGTGGNAGRIWFNYRSGGNYVSGLGTNKVISRGTLTSNGAKGAIGGVAYGGSGYGSTLLYGPDGVDNAAPISAQGGFGMPNGGGYGGDIILSSDVGQVSNTGAMTTSGGDGGSGGYAGDLCLEGGLVSNSGALTGVGGDAVTANPGRGASARFNSFNGATANTGTVDLAAGTGAPAANPGVLTVDSASSRCYTFSATF